MCQNSPRVSSRCISTSSPELREEGWARQVQIPTHSWGASNSSLERRLRSRTTREGTSLSQPAVLAPFLSFKKFPTLFLHSESPSPPSPHPWCSAHWEPLNFTPFHQCLHCSHGFGFVTRRSAGGSDGEGLPEKMRAPSETAPLPTRVPSPLNTKHSDRRESRRQD